MAILASSGIFTAFTGSCIYVFVDQNPHPFPNLIINEEEEENTDVEEEVEEQEEDIPEVPGKSLGCFSLSYFAYEGGQVYDFGLHMKDKNDKKKGISLDVRAVKLSDSSSWTVKYSFLPKKMLEEHDDQWVIDGGGSTVIWEATLTDLNYTIPWGTTSPGSLSTNKTYSGVWTEGDPSDDTGKGILMNNESIFNTSGRSEFSNSYEDFKDKKGAWQEGRFNCSSLLPSPPSAANSLPAQG